MSIYLKVQLQNQPVLIIGGGKVAYRKAKAYHEQGALLSVLSVALHDDFKTLPCNWIKKPYTVQDLRAYFFVYAATNQPHINEQICNDANAQHVLCASATKTNANALSMAYQETTQFQVAVASTIPYPPLYPNILEEMTQVLQPYDDKMKFLTSIRKRLQLVIEDEEIRKTYAYEYATLAPLLLQSLTAAIQKEKLLILLYHGSKDPQAYEDEVLPFQCTIQAHVDAPVMSVYIKQAYVDSMQTKETELCSYEQLLHLLKPLQILFWVQPMLLAKGRYYERYKDSVSYFGTPLLEEEKDCSFVHDWMNTITPHACVALYHASRFTLEQSLLAIQKQHHYFMSNQNKGEVPIKEDEIALCSMYILKGFHQQQDLRNCANHLMKTGKQVSMIETSFLLHPIICNIWLQKIQELLKKN